MNTRSFSKWQSHTSACLRLHNFTVKFPCATNLVLTTSIIKRVPNTSVSKAVMKKNIKSEFSSVHVYSSETQQMQIMTIYFKC